MSKRTSKKEVRESRLIDFFHNLTIDCDALSPRADHTAFAVNRLRERMRKRAKVTSPELHSKAITDFVANNLDVATTAVTLDPAIVNAASDFIRYVLTRAVKKRYPDSLQECFSHSWIEDEWAFGPGASNGVKHTGTVRKIDQPMTCTNRAEPWVAQWRSRDPYFQGFDARNGNNGVRIVPGSRLTTVLKNEISVRTIAIEGSGNMAFQLAGGRVIESALRDIGLDIRHQQDLNILLARRGSLDGSLFTMDLKSASDRILRPLVRILWPSEWYTFFERFRSPVAELPDGTLLELEMMSTMGNGYTFPLMTLTLLALVYANRLVNHNGPFRYIDWRVTAVFGDDIIAPTDEYSTLFAQLVAAGFLVNHEKSYSTGLFRESCGGDYYAGKDVTPFYVKSLNTKSEVYVAMNQVITWSAVHKVPMYRSLYYLRSLLKGKVFLVPEWCADTSGIRTSQCSSKYKYLHPIREDAVYDGFFSFRLFVGGYLFTEGTLDCLYYTPSPRRVRYEVRHAKLPTSYLDGWDPGFRTCSESSYASLMVSMVI